MATGRLAYQAPEIIGLSGFFRLPPGSSGFLQLFVSFNIQLAHILRKGPRAGLPDRPKVRGHPPVGRLDPAPAGGWPPVYCGLSLKCTA